VCFLTNDVLRAHLDRYRVSILIASSCSPNLFVQSQERLLFVNLEQCHAHSSQLSSEYETTYIARDGEDDHVDSDADRGDGNFYDPVFLRNNTHTNQLYCPHEECDHSEPFTRRQRLIRHFTKCKLLSVTGYVDY
jgi:hypothetical protein